MRSTHTAEVVVALAEPEEAGAVEVEIGIEDAVRVTPYKQNMRIYISIRYQRPSKETYHCETEVLGCSICLGQVISGTRTGDASCSAGDEGRCVAQTSVIVGVAAS